MAKGRIQNSKTKSAPWINVLRSDKHSERGYWRYKHSERSYWRKKMNGSSNQPRSFFLLDRHDEPAQITNYFERHYIMGNKTMEFYKRISGRTVIRTPPLSDK